MKVAIIGTVGIPAIYGGFETLVEQLVKNNNSENLQYAVYSSKKAYKNLRWIYQGAKIEYVNLNANGAQSILYDIVSLIKASRNSDTILILGVSGCAFLPIFRIFSKKRLIINIDGLEHKREKWNKWIRKFLKYSEKQAIKYGDVIVTDNKAITDYVKQEYGYDSKLIAYGGDHALVTSNTEESNVILQKYNLNSDEYSLAICRIEPENNVHIILEAFACKTEKLVFIGNWQKNEYGKELLSKYKYSNNILLLSAIYDLKTLNVLRSHCKLYLHGHSAGGTNPSLVEAMFFGKPILAFDVIYNRETTENKAQYFKDSISLAKIIEEDNSSLFSNASSMLEIASRRYQWRIIAKKYEQLY